MNVQKGWLIAIPSLSLIAPAILSVIWGPYPIYLLHMVVFGAIFGPAVIQPTIKRFFLWVTVSSVAIYLVGYAYYIYINSRWYPTINWNVGLDFVCNMFYPFVINMVVGILFVALPFCFRKRTQT